MMARAKSGTTPVRVTRVRGDRRVIGVAVWDASPRNAEPVRWSEVAPAVIPKQTLVSVEISDGETSEIGVAGVTHYLTAQDEPELPSERRLSAWLDVPIRGPVERRADDDNPYEPAVPPLGAVVELAALDALGRQTDLPAGAFLGGVSRAKIPAYASLPSFSGPDAAIERAVAAVGAGFTAIKFHASGALDLDLRTISSARDELGPSIRLMWDASRAYDLHSALLVGIALVREGFLWFEAPLAHDSAGALRHLAGRIQIPLVPDGMAHRSEGDWGRDLADGAWGALRPDITRAPTIGSALRLVRLAESFGFPCEIQSFGFALTQYANLQLMLTTRACRFFEAPFPASDCEDGLVNAPAIDGGFVTASAATGLGAEIEFEDLSQGCRLLVRVGR